MFNEREAANRAAEDLRERGITQPLRAPGWDRELRPPRIKLPPGACDSHLHMIGPQAVFPLLHDNPFNYLQFDDSTFEDWSAVRDALGFARGVHVQSFMYGYGYNLMLHTLM